MAKRPLQLALSCRVSIANRQCVQRFNRDNRHNSLSTLADASSDTPTASAATASAQSEYFSAFSTDGTRASNRGLFTRANMTCTAMVESPQCMAGEQQQHKHLLATCDEHRFTPECCRACAVLRCATGGCIRLCCMRLCPAGQSLVQRCLLLHLITAATPLSMMPCVTCTETPDNRVMRHAKLSYCTRSYLHGV